ncbi:MAG: chitosanase, partial [Sediminibacterium sp.]|nr:chitosanase [Sediminibacterium sp.]
IVLFGCKKEETTEMKIITTDSTNLVENNLIPFTTAQKLLADKIVSCFENNNPIIQYDYIENLDDGRGYTAGKVGFTTANGDLLEVIKYYTKSNAQNSLITFIPELEKLAKNEDPDISGLTNLPAQWKANVNNPAFIEAQNYVGDLLYYQPAVKVCTDYGFKYPISLMCLYDCCIQHGNGDDPDGLNAIIKSTFNAMNGYPKDGKNEIDWIIKFNEIRKSVLLNPSNKDTKTEWAMSVGRVDALQKLIQIDKNYKFNQATIQINPFGTNFILNLP